MRLAAVLVLAAGCAAAAPSEAPTDTVLTDPSVVEPWQVRGTVEPLAPRSTGRDILAPAARTMNALVWAAVKPIQAVIGWDERHGYSRAVMTWFTRDVQAVNTQFAAYLGYETGFGVTLVGLRIHSRDWYGTGLDNRFRFSYLSPRDNVVEVKLAGSDDELSFRTRTRFRRLSDRDFYGYGLGDRSSESDFDTQLFLNELGVERAFAGDLTLGLDVFSRSTRVLHHALERSVPLPEELWTRAASNHYWGFEAGLRRDTRDRGEMAASGTLSRVAVGWNAARAVDDSDYRHLTVELQAHRAVFRDRSFAARVFYEGVEADDMARLPFTELRGLGGRHDLRGFARDRFVDAHLLALSLDYRYPVFKTFQGRLFSDWGTVAPAFDELDLSELRWSMGLGVVMPVHDDLFVIQYARGSEGGHLYVGTSTPFGYQSRRKR